MGTSLLSHLIENRKPFMDNELLEFVYSLPDEYKLDSRIYNKALLLTFPEFYEEIPWERKGVSISTLDNSPYKKTFKEQYQRFFRKFIGTGKLLLKKIGARQIKRLLFGQVKSKTYTDYNMWLKDTKYRDYFTELLDSNDSEYKKYTDEDFYKKYFLPHIQNKEDFSEKIGRALTIEIWLKQVKNRGFKG